MYLWEVRRANRLPFFGGNLDVGQLLKGLVDDEIVIIRLLNGRIDYTAAVHTCLGERGYRAKTSFQIQPRSSVPSLDDFSDVASSTSVSHAS